MATDPRKRQKKQERRTAKRKEKKHVGGREHSGGLPEQLTAAALFPVLHCWMGKSFAEHGIGWVVLSRTVPGGPVVVSSFLVDRYCLGVKDTHTEALDRLNYDAKYLRKAHEMELRNVSPAEARKFLEEAVAYAHSIGLRPHAGYARAMSLFGNINPAESNSTFEFGKDGKPFFIAGPNDGPERCKEIITILRNTLGMDNFHYLIPVSPDMEVIPIPGGEVKQLEDGRY